MKVLITGFEPFGSWQRNPSGETARSLDGITIASPANLSPITITGIVLPVSYQHVTRPLLTAIDELQPDVVLSLGQATTDWIRVERVAVNHCEGCDNDGFDPQGKAIIQGGPETYYSLLPVDEIVQSLSHDNFSVQTSDSAGTYLCNYVMYTVLHHIASRQLKIRAGFIHAAPLRQEDADTSNGKGMDLKEWMDFTVKIVEVLSKEKPALA